MNTPILMAIKLRNTAANNPNHRAANDATGLNENIRAKPITINKVKNTPVNP